MTSEDAAQAVGFGVEELIGKPMKFRKHAPKGEIVAEMLQEERRRRIRLKNVGRSFLTDVPFEERETHENEHNLPVLSNSNASVDLKVAGATVKRCFYDADGNILQEIHYLHQDSRGTHLFPHIHIWIEGERCFAIAYRDQDNIVRYRRARKMKKEKHKKVHVPEPIARGFKFMWECREWRRRNGFGADCLFKYYEPQDLESVISSIKDVQVLLSCGLELAVRYKNCNAYIEAFAQQFCIDAICDGKDYWWSAFTLDELEDAMVGPYRLKDIVDKWEIVEFN